MNFIDLLLIGIERSKFTIFIAGPFFEIEDSEIIRFFESKARECLNPDHSKHMKFQVHRPVFGKNPGVVLKQFLIGDFTITTEDKGGIIQKARKQLTNHLSYYFDKNWIF